MIKIKPVWKNHPLYKQNKIELVPTAWVWKYRGPDVTPINLNALWADICEKGLVDPFIMRVGIHNKKFRLEAGNHRIQVFRKNGIKMVPVTVQVRAECGPEAKDTLTDASHNFDAKDEILISRITEEYMKPSEVFKSLSKKFL